MKLILTVSLTVLMIGYVWTENHDISTLKLLQIVHRHGDRTPFEFYPKDPYQNETEWPDGIGGLTPRGKERMYKFGLKLREIYYNFYGDSPRNIYVRSSAVPRCLETVQAILAGMYIPTGHWKWTDYDIGKYWEPIPIETVPKNADGLLVPDSDCPAADKELQNIYNTNKDVQEIMKNNSDFLAKITAKTNFPIPTIDEGYYLSDILQTEHENNRNYSKWVNEIDNNTALTLEKLHKFVIYAFRYDWSTPTMQRLRAGLILQELTEKMKNAIGNTKQQLGTKVYDYSSHDTQVAVILHALKVYDDIPPTYGSAIIFELHSQSSSNNADNDYVVKLFYTHLMSNYQNTTFDFQMTQLYLTSVCGRRECTVTEFSNYVQQFIPNDWNHECTGNNGRSRQNFDRFFHNLFLCTIFVYLYLILVLL